MCLRGSLRSPVPRLSRLTCRCHKTLSNCCHGNFPSQASFKKRYRCWRAAALVSVTFFTPQNLRTCCFNRQDFRVSDARAVKADASQGQRSIPQDTGDCSDGLRVCGPHAAFKFFPQWLQYITAAEPRAGRV